VSSPPRTFAMRWPGIAFGCWLLAVAPLAADEPKKFDLLRLPPAASGTMDFVRDIQPIFAKNCLACHGSAKQRGGVRLDDAIAAQKGGNTGPIILPGKATQSRLLIVVSGLDSELVMPPKEKTPLTKEEIGRLRAWIEQGAKWPQAVGSSASTAKS